MLDNNAISSILSNFGLTFTNITTFYDTSHGEDDRRLNYVLDEKYVLKVCSVRTVWEQRLQEIQRLIDRYRSIGVYCPKLVPTLDGHLSCQFPLDGIPRTCFVEEYAVYPVCPDDFEPDRKEVLAHVGKLAARFSGVDLSPIHSMWSIIDLAPLDVDVDEKQENTDMLAKALEDAGFPALAEEVRTFNLEIRRILLKDYKLLPRCVYQGDLNSSNELHQDGHFAGLIDFNMAGTDVNINVFVNETNWFPDTGEFDRLTVDEILQMIDNEQAPLLAVIFESYTMNDLERQLFPYYKRIADLFQWPNVCLMVKWLEDGARKEKCAALIRALVDKSF